MQVDVAIIGAGPTGLMLAHELRLAGVSVAVLERSTERSSQSKALNLQPRTAEVLDMRGLLDSLLERSFGNIADGHFAALPEPLRYGGWRTRHDHQVGIAQTDTERALEAAVAEVVRRGRELTGLDQGPDEVTVQLADGEEVTARWLVAADGGRSTVRKLLGTPFDGRDARTCAVVADITLASGAETLPSEFRSMRAFTGTVETWTPLYPIGGGKYRIMLIGERQQRAAKDDPVTEEEIREGLAAVHGDQVTLGELLIGSRFTDANRQVRNYREGRVFYAGDAAHIHLPAGGQGLNLGVQDAVNLGWKLAAVLRGEAPETLLDSYHAERHPVGARVLQNTRAQGILIGLARDPDGTALRETFTTLMEFPEVNRYLAGMVSGLDIRYPSDCGHELAGQRLIDYDLADGGRTFERMRSGEWVALTAQEAPKLEAEAVLVRPDGYVHWAGERAGLEAALATRFGSVPVTT
ncbi:FAD-dependent oxidoreductase [Sciscionella marina]|uniref:FAD-dependent oxidoreductase n=1 Tax=Sciscionella marina TaxID=508770 RepID=UPI00036E547D|nr:FAD-dependent oxidoreductase [Sciscionella marina]